ncbi:hypothetical protein TeGR_g7258, partial [Tetraparma gracilis]
MPAPNSSSDASRPRISRFWVFLILLLQAGLLAVTLTALRLDAAAPSTPRAAELSTMFMYLAECVWPLQFFCTGLMHDPLSHRPNILGPVEPLHAIGAVLAVLQRSLLSLRSSAGVGHNYGLMYVLESVVFMTGWSCSLQWRRLIIRSTFSPLRTRRFVYFILPAALMGALTPVLFLMGESVSCLTEKLSDDCGDASCGGLDGCRELEEEYFCARQRWTDDDAFRLDETTCNFAHNMC